MFWIFKILFLVAAVATISGCAATGSIYQTVEPARDKSVLVIYRPESWALGVRTAAIEIDGKRLVGLKNNGHATVGLTPGRKVIIQKWDSWVADYKDLSKPLKIEVELRSGQTHYVRLSSSASTEGRVQTIRWELREVLNSQADLELPITRRVDLESSFLQ